MLGLDRRAVALKMRRYHESHSRRSTQITTARSLTCHITKNHFVLSGWQHLISIKVVTHSSPSHPHNPKRQEVKVFEESIECWSDNWRAECA